MARSKALKIDMMAGSQLRDTQGETLSVEGADISELQAGRGRINDNHGKGFFNAIGRVTSAKKIFKVEDCDNDRQKYYWDQVKTPYIYVTAELFNDEDHPNAKAAAAVLSNIHKTDCPLKMKASVEGGVVARGISDPTFLARTKIHSVALTMTPANNATLVEPISLNKSQRDEVADMVLIKSLMHLAESNVPSFRHIARDASANKVVENFEKIGKELSKATGLDVKIPTKDAILAHALEQKIATNIKEIKKAMIAGYGGAGSPSSMVSGSVIQAETLQNPGLKHISCDKCGKEQVMAKHQIQCRECRHNFSLEKLYGVFKG